MTYEQNYRLWLDRADESLQAELKSMGKNPDAIEDAFYRDLAFGTGGLRGVIGAGTNRMNLHTVARASQGLADYVNARFAPEERRIAVSYDSRILSPEFARTAASVFAANGIRVHIYSRLMPTPCLSWATRMLKCAAGVMVTASHNPAEYNGYKVYGADGCQITTKAAKEILCAIDALDMFDAPRRMDFDEGLKTGLIRWIGEDVLDAYLEAVKAQSLLGDAPADRLARIVYTPLNGTGLEPVTRALRECGYRNVTVVAEQEQPDGHFPTCPYPNPEIQEAMALGLEYARRLDADLLLATDPDCDRCGIAVKSEDGYRLLSGNETGMLLLDYICGRRKALGKMPDAPVMVKTIVTTDMAQRIAEKHGVDTVHVLTGFKYIGETIGRLEARGEAARYIFGFEESYGYLTGSYVRDKDGVNAALMICEMFAHYRARGMRLWERLEQLYAEYGYCLNTLHSYRFEGSKGMARMKGVMAALRGGVCSLGGRRVEKLLDYAQGIDGLPKSDVIKLILSDGNSLVIRPSGTEPKLKLYTSVRAASKEQALNEETVLESEIKKYVGL